MRQAYIFSKVESCGSSRNIGKDQEAIECDGQRDHSVNDKPKVTKFRLELRSLVSESTETGLTTTAIRYDQRDHSSSYVETVLTARNEVFISTDR